MFHVRWRACLHNLQLTTTMAPSLRTCGTVVHFSGSWLAAHVTHAKLRRDKGVEQAARTQRVDAPVGRSCTTPSIRRARAAKRVMGKIRKWKGPARDKPFSQTTIDKGNKLSLEKKMQIRAERAAVQAAQRAIDEDRRAEARAAREEREAREARKKENKEKRTAVPGHHQHVQDQEACQRSSCGISRRQTQAGLLQNSMARRWMRPSNDCRRAHWANYTCKRSHILFGATIVSTDSRARSGWQLRQGDKACTTWAWLDEVVDGTVSRPYESSLPVVLRPASRNLLRSVWLMRLSTPGPGPTRRKRCTSLPTWPLAAQRSGSSRTNTSHVLDDC